MTVNRFFTPSVVVKNISRKAVNLIGRVTIKPGDTIDLYNALDVPVELFEDQIIKGLEKPYGDLYRESQEKKSIVILTLRLTSFHYSIVSPENINAINNYSPGLIPAAINGEQFEWISATGITVDSPLQLTGNNLSLPPASASSDGYLTKEDWSRFNAAVKGAIRIWQYQDFPAPVANSVTLTSFENGSGLVFNSGYILDSTAEVVLTNDTSSPPTTTLSIPAKYLPGNRVSVSSHIGTTIVFNNIPDSSLNVRVFFLISVPSNIPLPNDYQEDPEFLNDSSLEYLDDIYVNQNQDESIYGIKTFEDKIVLNSTINIPTGAIDGYVLTSNGIGNASWETNTWARNIGNDGYGVFSQRIGSTLLEFKNINVGSNNLTVDEFLNTIVIDTHIDNLRYSLSNPESEPTGFPNRTDSVISFDNITRTLTVSPAGISFEIYTSARRRVYFSPQSIIIPDTEGIWFIYFDTNGILTAVPSFNLNLITTYAYVCIIYWDSTNKQAIYIGEERHGITMDGITHAYLHQYNGTIYLNGLGISNLTVDGSGASNLEAQYGIDDGLIYDEDISLSIVDGAPQNIFPYANLPIFYRSGANGNWRRKTADSYGLIYSGTAGYTGANGRPPYNQYTGSTWQLTQVTNNGFFFVHIIATNDINNPIIGIQGISEYTNISSARENAALELGQLSGLPFTEFVTIGTIIFQTSNSYTNVPKVRVRSTSDGADYVDWRETNRAITDGSFDHGNLIGLGDDDHLQYLLLTGDAVRNAVTGKINLSSGELTLPTSTNPSVSYPSATLGDIAFDSDDGYVVFYNGISWVPISSGGGAGDVTGATNIGTDGYGFFVQKNGTILEFKNIVAGANYIKIYADLNNIYVDIVPNLLSSALNLDGYFNLSQDETITGHTTFAPSLTSNPALTITPNSSTPTTNVSDGSVAIVGGIQYNYDGTRSKWLSNERKFLISGFNSSNTSNSYLNLVGSVASSATGYRLLRNGTLTGIWAQTQNIETWIFEIRKNGVATPVASLSITSSRGASNNSLNVDVNIDDEIQFYVNGTSVSRPVVGIELAWRI